MDGGTGNDLMFGNCGGDLLDGDSVDDELHGEKDCDALIGDQGQDILYGDSGDDKLQGNEGEDTLYGGANHDILSGDDANDVLYGELNDDVLDGGESNDLLLNGGKGRDIFNGDIGDDTYTGYSSSGWGFDIIADLDTSQSINNDNLDPANFTSTTPLYSAVDYNGNGNLDSLYLNFGSGNSISAYAYFDDTTSNLADLASGQGEIEDITFSNAILDFNDVKTILTT